MLVYFAALPDYRETVKQEFKTIKGSPSECLYGLSKTYVVLEVPEA